MIFKQYRFEPLGQASYIVGCMTSKKAFVIDPIADLGPDHYVREAADLGLTIAGVLDTHVHADYISCARELAAETSAPYYMHESLKGLARFDFEPVTDGQVLELGRIAIEVVHTPGHTPEHCSYLVYDRARSEDPWLVLTGDCLFVGDVGRPDLLLEDQALNVLDESERAAHQYSSIKLRLFALPGHVEVWPAHYGGSSCGGVNMSGKASSTIHYEKNHNLALQQPDVEAFARFVTETARPFPENYRTIKAYNLGLIARDELEPGSSEALSASETAEAVEDGVVLVDLRPPLVFARSHVPGAVNLQYNPADLADRAEMGLGGDLRLIVYGDSDALATSAAGILESAGFEVLGHLAGGVDAWIRDGRDAATLPVLDVDELRRRLDEVEVVDAREGFEYRYGHIPGAHLLPSMGAWGNTARVPSERPLAVVCGDQTRSALVASVLLREGRDARLVSGGMTDWIERGYPLEKSG